MNYEKIIFEITAASRSRSQKGDVSQFLQQQGFFDTPSGKMPKSLQERDPQLTGKNPIDIKKDFFKKNPN